MPHSPLSQSTTPEESQPILDQPNHEYKLIQPQHQTRSNTIQTILLILLTLGVGFGGGQWWATHRKTPTDSASQQSRSRTVPVKLMSINPTSLQETSEFVGTLEARQAVEVRSEVEGRINQILVEAGDFVESGQIIARLNSNELETNLRAAQANLVQTRARLAELEAGSRPEEIAQAQAKLIEAQAELEDAQSGSLLAEINQAISQIDAIIAAQELADKRVNRFQTLSKQGAISQDEFDELLSEKATTAANLKAAERRLEQLEKTRDREINLRIAVVEQEAQALQQLRNGNRPEEIQQAEAEVAGAVAQVRRYQVLLQEMIITAPFSGMIGDVVIKLGDFVRSGDVVTTLTENQQLELRLPIPIERKSDLRLGLPVQIQDSQGSDLGVGQISFISPTVNQDSQTILAKATLNQDNQALKDGQFVKAIVVWNQRQNQVVIPLTAITFQGQQQFVYIAMGNDTLIAQKTPVQLGLIEGDRAEVTTGLQAGQKLIISGIQRLSDGAEVNPIEGE
ncbi:MAG: efflux RND transporter periplasmic adaptor subunit [Microcoleaceae cyanobacterium]